MDAMFQIPGKFIENFWPKRDTRDFRLTQKVPQTCSMLHKTGSTQDISMKIGRYVGNISIHQLVDFQTFPLQDANFSKISSQLAKFDV